MAGPLIPLSLLIAGPVADRLVVRFWYTLGELICIVVTIVAGFVPAIMNIVQSQGSPEGSLAPD